MVLALLLPVPVGGQLGSSQVPSDDDSTRLASFPLTAVSHYAPASTLDEVFFVSTHDPDAALEHDPSLADTSAFARGVYKGYGVEVTEDAPVLRVAALPRLANSTVKMRSYAYNRTVHTWVNSTFNATTNVTTDETITEILEEYAYDGATRGWVTASNETGGDWLSSTVGLVPLEAFNVTTVRGARDQRRGPTLERHLSPRGDAFERVVRVSRRHLTAGLRVARVDSGVPARRAVGSSGRGSFW